MWTSSVLSGSFPEIFHFGYFLTQCFLYLLFEVVSYLYLLLPKWTSSAAGGQHFASMKRSGTHARTYQNTNSTSCFHCGPALSQAVNLSATSDIFFPSACTHNHTNTTHIHMQRQWANAQGDAKPYPLLALWTSSVAIGSFPRDLLPLRVFSFQVFARWRRSSHFALFYCIMHEKNYTFFRI